MRRRTAKKRHILPDPRFNDVVVTKFVNNMMLDGKKKVTLSKLAADKPVFLIFGSYT